MARRPWIYSSHAARSAVSTRRFAGGTLVLLLVLISAACGQPDPGATSSTLDTKDIQMLTQTTIFFGHQSVGGNIIQGIEELLIEPAYVNAHLTIRNVSDPAAMATPALLHTTVGENYNPVSKIQAFDQLIRNGLGNQVDVAFFKFCYVDFDQNTDVQQLFETYKQTMADLARSYPETQFVHVTVPLMAQGKGVKFFVKNLMGREDPATANLQRHRFNELLRQAYAGKEPMFDLAQFEATYAGDKTCTMTIQNQTVPCLYAGYTDDGGHLNEPGRKFVAEHLLLFLTTLTTTTTITN